VVGCRCSFCRSCLARGCFSESSRSLLLPSFRLLPIAERAATASVAVVISSLGLVTSVIRCARAQSQCAKKVLGIADVGAPSPLLPESGNASLALALNGDIPLALKDSGDGHVIRQIMREGITR